MSAPFRDCRPARKHAAGFTLIDIAITIAIVGLLATVAYFSFANGITKAKRSECKNALLAAAQAEESFFTSNNQYASTLAALNINPYSGSTQAGSACLLSDPVADPSLPGGQNGTMASFIVTATTQFVDSQCGTTWSINSLGQKVPDPSGVNTSVCW